MSKSRWVLWFRQGSSGEWALRQGRYASKEAATDAVSGLLNGAGKGFQYLPLPEGKIPQDNVKSRRPSRTPSPEIALKSG